MASSNLLLILVACVSLASSEWNTKDYFRREHSLSKPYGGSGASIPYWNFIGNTIVSNKYIRLASDTQGQNGAIWNVIPVGMTDWEMQIQFKVSGSGRELFGDGMAIWYTKDANVRGDVFGYVNPFNGLAIFLDTYSNHVGPNNHQFPYISAMVSNGSLKYDHDKDGSNTQLAGCEAQFRNKDYDTYIAIRYHNYKLTVSTDVDNKNSWKECFSVDNVHLPTRYYFGMSAATGDLSDNHDVISVKVYQLESPRKDETIDHAAIDPIAKSFHPVEESNDESKQASSGGWSGWKIFGVILLVIVSLSLVGIAVYFVMKRQSHSKKRFY